MNRRPLLSTSIAAALIATALAIAEGNSRADNNPWRQPTAPTIQKIGPSDDIVELQHLENIPCTKTDYDAPTSTNGRQTLHGCFVQTAFGALDIRYPNFGYTNAAGNPVRLAVHHPDHLYVPWPGSGSLLTLEAASGGSTVKMYGHVPSVLEDKRDVLGRLTHKRITAPPNHVFYNPDGSVMRANLNTVTFSENGYWLVLETRDGFVRINGASLNAHYFSKALYGNAALSGSQLAISKSGQYVAVSNVRAGIFKIYDLNNCSRSVPITEDCPAYNFWPHIKEAIPDISVLTTVRFTTDDGLSFLALTKEGRSIYRLTPHGAPAHLLEYLALGDSFTSGEGAFSYIKDTDTARNACHHSSQAYPYLIRTRLYSSVSAHSVACSGAKMHDILPANLKYKGQVSGGTALQDKNETEILRYLSKFQPGELPQGDFVSRYQPRTLSVSIGGNDIGFGKIIEQCVAPRLSRHINRDNICYNTYEDRVELANRIDRQKDRLVTMLKNLKSKSPQTNIYLIGYPQIAVDTGSCAANVLLGTGELAFSIEIITRLNTILRQAAAQAKVHYVDISDALEGHRLCEGNSPAMHGLTYGNDGGKDITIGGLTVRARIIGRESYHPTELGQELIAKEILEKTKGFSLALPAGATPAPPDRFTDKPKTGRTITLSHAADLTNHKVTAAGKDLAISVDGNEFNLRPNASYAITVNNTVVQHVHTTINTAISTIVNMPADSPPGVTIIVIGGEDQSGQPVTIIDTVYIVVRDDDYDGDGIKNNEDSCPTAPDSGTDADTDGIDDICDAVVVPTPSEHVLPIRVSDTSANSSPPAGRANTFAITTASSAVTAAVATNRPGLSPKGSKPVQVRPRDNIGKPVVAHAIPTKLPVIAILVVFVGWLVALLMAIGVGRFLQWRRERDSNPRYP